MKRKKPLRELFNLQGGFCAYCEKKMDITKCNTDDAPTIDHVQSKSNGGSNHPHNLVCACRKCNSDKADLPLAVFLVRLRQSRPVLVYK